jgi:hypothetical protein
VIRPILAACLVVLLATFAPSCGGTQSSRQSTIASLDSGIQTATAALRSYEHEHAMAIIEHAPDKATAHASLVAFRAKADKVWIVVDAARYAIDAANTVNDDPSIAGARTALANALDAIAALTGGTP